MLRLALLLAAVVAAQDASGLRDLTAGRYELKLRGTLCAACLRAVAQELAKHRAVEKASTDVPAESVRVAVKSDQVLPAADVRRALRRAERAADLGARYEVAAVRYELTPLTPGAAPSPKKKP